jgi:hypothetical protein
MPTHLPRRLPPLLGALLLAACGGSGDEPTVAVTGSVFAGPVSGARVLVRGATGAEVGAAVSTAADGAFSIRVPASVAAGPFFLEATGGTFTDEATGAPTEAGRLLAHAAAGALAQGGSLHLTPQSTVVATMVRDGATLGAANAAFQAAFGFTPDAAVAPANAPVAGAALAPAQAALRAAAFSQLAHDLGLTPAGQFGLFPALAADAADGALDGRAGGLPVVVGDVTLPADVQNRFAAALLAWRGSPGDLTGLQVDQLGAPPFALTALSASYRVEYLPGVMAAAVGRSDFRVKVTDRASGAPVAGLQLGLMPRMHMSTRSHATPIDPVEEEGAGVYRCTVYYVMASAMADGTSMGVWELGVSTGGMGGETATFYPQVAMSMGDTRFVRLTGPAGSTDMILSTPAPAKRTYQVFHDGLTLGAGGATFRVLVTTMDTLMSFPHLSPGVTLHRPDPTDPAVPLPFQVGSVSVRVSADGGGTWAAASDLGNGHWSAEGLQGLTAGAATSLRVELAVDGEVKATQDLSASHATFALTPAATP